MISQLALEAMRPKAGAPSAEWAARIAACWRASVEGVLEVGRLLTAAKDALEHGQYEAMIESDLPFTASTARRLMAIGEDPRLSDRAHVHVLPASWGTLYELTKLDDKTFKDKVSDGTIRPDIERSEVSALRKAIRKEPERQAYKDRVDAGCTLADLVALADQGAQFGAISADPNWQYKTYSEKGKDRSPDQHYTTSDLAPMLQLPVKRLAAKNSVLHLWCMDWLLPGAITLVNEWGFTLINIGFVWNKLNPSGEGSFMGMGHWTRNGAELCLFATKGNPTRRNASVRQVIDAPVGRHSEKPDEFYRRVAALTDGPYLDLYARKMREGWTCWGNEIPRANFAQQVTCDEPFDKDTGEIQEPEAQHVDSALDTASEPQSDEESPASLEAPCSHDAGAVQDRCESTAPQFEYPEMPDNLRRPQAEASA